jgi:hypothetical protein
MISFANILIRILLRLVRIIVTFSGFIIFVQERKKLLDDCAPHFAKALHSFILLPAA